jgi:hypothetical protein
VRPRVQTPVSPRKRKKKIVRENEVISLESLKGELNSFQIHQIASDKYLSSWLKKAIWQFSLILGGCIPGLPSGCLKV